MPNAEGRMEETIETLTAERDALAAELAEAHDRFGRYVAGQVTLTDLRLEDGLCIALDMKGLAQIMAASFLDGLDEADATNYVEMQLQTDDGRRVTVTVQRHGTGVLTPHQARAKADVALAAARAENERLREENVAADGTARAAVELVQDCREVLGLDRGASLTAAVMRAAKDARRYHALRVFLRPELFDRRWQVTADAEDLLNALAATYSFDAREDVNIDAAIDALAAQDGTR